MIWKIVNSRGEFEIYRQRKDLNYITVYKNKPLETWYRAIALETRRLVHAVTFQIL